jgi:hypothetical protein
MVFTASQKKKLVTVDLKTEIVGKVDKTGHVCVNITLTHVHKAIVAWKSSKCYIF